MTCDLCTGTKVKVKTKDSSTTNLYSHLRYHHPSKHAEIAPVAQSTPKPKKAKMNQPTIQQAVERKTPYTIDSERHKLLVKNVTHYLVSGETESALCDYSQHRFLL